MSPTHPHKAESAPQSSANPSPSTPAWLQPQPDGCTLTVWLQPAARRDAILGPHGDALRIAVRAPAQRGQANLALIRFLAQLLQLPPENLSLAHGFSSRRKRIRIHGLNCQEVQQRLAPRGSPSS